MELTQKQTRSGLEVLDLDQKYIKSGIDEGVRRDMVLEVQIKWIRCTGSKMEVDQKYWKQNRRSIESRIEVDQNYWKQTRSGLKQYQKWIGISSGLEILKVDLKLIKNRLEVDWKQKWIRRTEVDQKYLKWNKNGLEVLAV